MPVPFPSVSIDPDVHLIDLKMQRAINFFVTLIRIAPRRCEWQSRKNRRGLPIPAALSEKSELVMFHRDDFVLLTDDIKSWIVRIEDIALLEAWQTDACPFPRWQASDSALSRRLRAEVGQLDLLSRQQALYCQHQPR